MQTCKSFRTPLIIVTCKYNTQVACAYICRYLVCISVVLGAQKRNHTSEVGRSWEILPGSRYAMIQRNGRTKKYFINEGRVEV